MSAIGIWAEVSEGRFKKPVLETLTAGRSFADREGLPLWAIVVSGETLPDNLLQTLADYGADKVILITHGDLQAFISNAYARVLAQYV